MNISDLNLLAKQGDSNAQLQLGIMLVQKYEYASLLKKVYSNFIQDFNKVIKK